MKRQIAALLDSSPTPQLDADCILQWILRCDKTQLLLRRNDSLTPAQIAAAQEAAATRRTGFPIAYITGSKAFFGNDFYVTPAVLIPKPDTELLVEQTIAAVRAAQAARPQQKIAVCDMCAGSGCVGISVLRALGGGISLTLVDVSADALQVARTNARRLLSPAVQDDVRFVRSNLFEHVPQTFQVIAANPPYVPHTQAQALLQDGRGEPLLALDGDVTESGGWSGTEDGLALIRRLVPQAYTHLADGGVLLMETGEYNAQETAAYFAQAGIKNIHIEKDLSGQLRNVVGTKSTYPDAIRNEVSSVRNEVSSVRNVVSSGASGYETLRTNNARPRQSSARTKKSVMPSSAKRFLIAAMMCLTVRTSASAT